MTDFWSQLIEYTNKIDNDTTIIDNPEHILAKILNSAEDERQTLEAQVRRYIK